MESIDWKEAAHETQAHLKRLIKFDTTNPPGNETPCIEDVAGVLREAGYDPVVLESASGRGNVVVRFKGTGEKKPLLIYGHVDVVNAEADKWRHPPFAADAADGCIWGRGALDMKDMVSYELECMLLLMREKPQLQRDVIFAATADEEAGGRMGAGWLVENRPDLVEAEYGLSEGAGSTLQVNGRRFYGIRTAEKGTARFRLKASGQPGHGSVPRRNTAVHLISRAVSALYESRLPLHLTETTRRYMKVMGEAVGLSMSDQPDEREIDELAARLPSDLARGLQAVVRNTATPTGLRAGRTINVIPGEAEAGVDARIVPGQTPENLFDEVREIIGTDCEIEPIDRGFPQESEPGDDLYNAIERTIRRHDPDAKAVPVMLSGATDARWVSRTGTKCLGFSPLALPPNFSSEGLVHGHDERIPISGLAWGTRVFYEIVRDFASEA